MLGGRSGALGAVVCVLSWLGCESTPPPVRSAPTLARVRPTSSVRALPQRPPERVEPVLPPEPKSRDAAVQCQLLAEIDAEPTTLAADSSALYVGVESSAGGRLLRIDRRRYQQKKLADLPAPPALLHSDGSELFWVSPSTPDAGAPDHHADGAVLSVSAGGGTVRTLLARLRGPSGLALDGPNLFVAVFGDSTATTNLERGAILRLPKRGGATSVVAARQVRPRAPTVHGRWLFWGSADHRVHSVDKDGSRERSHDGGGCPVHFAAFGDALYWVAVATCTGATRPIAGSIRRAALGDPSQSATFAPGLHGPLRVAITERWVLWTSDLGASLGAVPRDAASSAATELAPECFGGAPLDVLADGADAVLVATVEYGAAGARGRVVRLELR